MINDKEFKKYEDVRKSGVTNMFDTETVSKLTGLNKEQIIEIMQNYSKLSDWYASVI